MITDLLKPLLDVVGEHIIVPIIASAGSLLALKMKSAHFPTEPHIIDVKNSQLMKVYAPLYKKYRKVIHSEKVNKELAIDIRNRLKNIVDHMDTFILMSDGLIESYDALENGIEMGKEICVSDAKKILRRIDLEYKHLKKILSYTQDGFVLNIKLMTILDKIMHSFVLTTICLSILTVLCTIYEQDTLLLLLWGIALAGSVISFFLFFAYILADCIRYLKK